MLCNYQIFLNILKTNACHKPHPLGCGGICFFDITIIPEEMAEVLGIEYKKDNLIYGIAREPVNAKEGKLHARFGKGKEFCSFEIPILVPTGKIEIPVIIGRAGFFNQFKITFIESERRIEFKKSELSLYKY